MQGEHDAPFQEYAGGLRKYKTMQWVTSPNYAWSFLQQFDAVGWLTGRAYDQYKQCHLSSKILLQNN